MWDAHCTRAPLSKKGSCQRQLTEGIDAKSRGEKDRVGRIRKATNLSDKIANTSPKCRKERTSYRLIPSGLRPAPLLCKGSSIRQYPGATVLCPFASMFLHFKFQFIFAPGLRLLICFSQSLDKKIYYIIINRKRRMRYGYRFLHRRQHRYL